MTQPIHFLYRGQPHSVHTASPNRTLLQYLREDLHCTGTKEGCAEGDCGACTVLLAEVQDNQGLQIKSVNACIQLLPAVHGKAVLTVEDCALSPTELHPVQQALVNCHASQCGFCTPGFVMSLWDLYLRHEGRERPTRQQIQDALSGNLCRCTGYRPIMDAAEAMFDLPRAEFERQALQEQLQALQAKISDTHYQYDEHACYWPQDLAQALQLRQAYPDAVLLAGGTDIGLWITKQMRVLPRIIYLGQVKELLAIQATKNYLEIGAAVNLNQAYAAICEYFPQLKEFWQRFASMPVRNAGTLGGNLANGSPIGDSMPWLICAGAQVQLQSTAGARWMALEDLYLAYQKKAMRGDEILCHIRIPLPQPSQILRSYKLSKRFDQDISAVCAAFAIELTEGKISSVRIAYGGMAATPKRAQAAEQALLGQEWNESSLKLACQALQQDYTPLSDMRASSQYRMLGAQNLLRRFWLETRLDDPLPPSSLNVFAQAAPGDGL